MNGHHWMPFYVAKYLGKTDHLTTLQHGAYLLLIMHYWQHGSLPSDVKNLQKICKISSYQWSKNWPVLSKFFTADLKHERVERELQKAENISIKRQFSGRRGGLKTAGYSNNARQMLEANGAPHFKQTGQPPYKEEEIPSTLGPAEPDPAAFETPPPRIRATPPPPTELTVTPELAKQIRNKGWNPA